jgi:threonyl-tRNA synthetase
MIKITLPNGSIKEFEKPVTGLDIGNSISPRLTVEVLPYLYMAKYRI